MKADVADSSRAPAGERRDDGDAWTQAMRLGDFARAWQVSDSVLRRRAGVSCHHWPRHLQYIWDGTPLDGRRVLVRCYHGLGDTVQFIRYASCVKRIAREVIVWAQAELLPLLRTADGIDRLLPLHDGTPEADYDVDVELMELPHVFRSTLETLPAGVPYLFPGEEGGADPMREPPGLRAARPLQVGVVWESGGWDRRRSIPVEVLAALTRVDGVELHALQQGPALRQWRAGWGGISGAEDVLELARRMRRLDLVISVDSFPAHLAGAVGAPTWTLLHSDPDWRWMLGRSDSPWYPTMRLWRQDRAGEWEPVVEAVAAALRSAAARCQASGGVGAGASGGFE